MDCKHPVLNDPGIVREMLIRLPNKTMADFDALPEGTLAQLINGVLVMTPSPLSIHQLAVGNLLVELTSFVHDHKLGHVVPGPMDVQFSDENIFQPDILFVSHERAEIITNRRIMGAPDLIVEVLSRTTGYYDLLVKKTVYEEHGVREYWIVDPMKRFIRVLVNNGDGFVQHTKDQSVGMVRSTILDGFEVDLAAIFGSVPTTK